MIYKSLHSNNDLQNSTQKTKDWATQSLQKGQAIPAQLVAPAMLLLLQTRWQIINKERIGLYVLLQRRRIRNQEFLERNVSIGNSWLFVGHFQKNISTYDKKA